MRSFSETKLSFTHLVKILIEIRHKEGNFAAVSHDIFHISDISYVDHGSVPAEK